MNPRPPLHIPPEYTVEADLGEGGMGVVVLARHASTGRRVALKTLTVTDANAIASFRQEIAALRHLDHPGVVRVWEDGVEAGVPWVAMELLSGRTLGQHLRPRTEVVFDEASYERTEQVDAPEPTRRPWTLRLEAISAAKPTDTAPSPRADTPELTFSHSVMEWLAHVAAVCETLAVVHGQGVVHGDLKPDNIVVTEDGRVVLVDFGLATRFGDRIAPEHIGQAGLVRGTLQYISPEAIRGERLDARSDLYAIGVLLYRIVTGEVPFDGNATTLLVQHLNTTPLPPSAHGLQVPPALERLILALLAKAPADRPGHAWAILDVLERVGVPRRPRLAALPYLFEAPLLQRQPVLQRFEALWPQEQRATAVVLTGAAGIGKTRLAMEIARRARGRGMEVVATWASSLDTDGLASHSPLQLFAPVFRRWLDALGPSAAWEQLGSDAPVLAPFVVTADAAPPLTSAPLSIMSSPQQLFGAVARVLDALTRNRPLCLLADDLQNADALSLLALEHLLTLPRPWLVVGVARAGHTTEELRNLSSFQNTTTITIDPLDAVSTGRMAAAMLGNATLASAIERELYTRSEGNPFFVAELLRFALAREVWTRDPAGRWQLAGDDEALRRLGRPSSIKELVQRRLDSLSAPVRRVCEVAAVAGREFSPRLVSEALRAPSSATRWALERLVGDDLLETTPDGNLRFSHQQVRDVAYDGLAPEVQRTLHRAIADALDAATARGERVEAAWAAWHRRCGEQPELAAALYITAGQEAAGRYAFIDAERHFESAAELAPLGSATHLQAWLAMAEHVLLAQSRHEEGRKLLASLDLSGAEPGLRGTALALHGEFLNNVARFDDALAVLTEALAILAPQDALRRARTLKVQADVLYRKGLFPRSLEVYEEARALATADRRLAANIDQNEALVHQAQGRYERALALYERALSSYQAIGDRRGEGVVLTNFANLCRGRGRSQQALNLHHAALAIHRQMRNRSLEALALNNIALVEQQMGHIERARELLEESLALRQELRDFRRVAYALGNLGDLYALLGRTGEAVERLDVAVSATRRLGERHRMLLHLKQIIRCWIQAGYLDRARPMLREATTLASELGERGAEADCIMLSAEIAELEGQPIVALEKLQRALAHLRDIRHEADVVTCLVLLARNHMHVNHLQIARRLLDEAVALADGLGDRPARALVQLQVASLERRHGRIDTARLQLEKAWRYFDHAGIEPARLECLCEQVEMALAEEGPTHAWLALAHESAAGLDLGPDSRLRRWLERLDAQAPRSSPA